MYLPTDSWIGTFRRCTHSFHLHYVPNYYCYVRYLPRSTQLSMPIVSRLTVLEDAPPPNADRPDAFNYRIAVYD